MSLSPQTKSRSAKLNSRAVNGLFFVSAGPRWPMARQVHRSCSLSLATDHSIGSQFDPHYSEVETLRRSKMSFRKITKNIYERSWKRKDGNVAKSFYFKLMIAGKEIHQKACHPDNPKIAAKTKREAESFYA